MPTPRLPPELWCTIIKLACTSVEDLIQFGSICTSISSFTLRSPRFVLKLFCQLFDPFGFFGSERLLTELVKLPTAIDVLKLAIEQKIITRENIPSPLTWMKDGPFLEVLISEAKCKVQREHFNRDELISNTPVLKTMLKYSNDWGDWRCIDIDFNYPASAQDFGVASRRDTDRQGTIKRICRQHNLFMACRYTDAPFVERLIMEKGFCYSKYPHVYHIALFFACLNGSIDIFDLLVRLRNEAMKNDGEDTHDSLKTGSKRYPMEGLTMFWDDSLIQCPFYAAWGGHIELLQHLHLKHNLDLSIQHRNWW
jgi:hypothetical protein